jgi:hypothetical protein
MRSIEREQTICAGIRHGSGRDTQRILARKWTLIVVQTSFHFENFFQAHDACLYLVWVQTRLCTGGTRFTSRQDSELHLEGRTLLSAPALGHRERFTLNSPSDKLEHIWIGETAHDGFSLLHQGNFPCVIFIECSASSSVTIAM